VGLYVYVKTGISYKILGKSTYAHPVDFLCVDLNIFGTRVLVAVIYCPPRTDGYSYYDHTMEELTDRYFRHIIMVDFNVDLLRDFVAARSFVEHFESLSLSVINREPTHFQYSGDPTLNDPFITNSSDDVDFFTQIDLPSLKKNA
jgi:hypothetical protein